MITYIREDPTLSPRDFDDFFVGWRKRPSSKTALRAVTSSYRYVVARDNSEGGGGRMVGFVSAVSDGVLCAYIPFLEVLPQYQGKGIGTELMRKLLEELSGVYMVDLTCDPGMQSFYARFGMVPATAMTIRNDDALSQAEKRKSVS